MTIAKRLIILLATLLGALIVVGGLALNEMRKQQDSVDYLSVNSIPSLAILDRVALNFAVLRGTVLRHIITLSDANMDKLEVAAREIRTRIDADLALYEKEMLSDNTDREMLQADKSSIAKYYVLMEEILPVSRSNQTAKASEMYLAAVPTIDATTRVLKEHAEYNLKLAKDTAEASHAAAARGTWIIGGVLAVAIVAGLFLGITTYRHVLVSLNGVRSLMQDIASRLDFTRRAPADGKDELAVTAAALNDLLARVQSSLKEMRSSAAKIGTSSADLSTASQQVSTGSSEQSEAASSMAAAIEELTVSINHVSDRASETNNLVIDAGKVARDGAATISQTLADIRHIETAVKGAAAIVSRLDEGSAKVNSVVAVIKEVADQTNLLALNAAIEAARAGEQGRGFAVVADEVRKLAERTSQSTQEISSTMLAMQTDANNAVKGMFTAVEQVENGVVHAQEAETAIREIESGADQTVTMVSEITNAIREQSTASSIIAQQVERIAQMAEENNAAAQNTASTSADLKTVATAMRAEIELYQV